MAARKKLTKAQQAFLKNTAAKQAKRKKADAEIPWGARIPKALLARVRTACTDRRNEGKKPYTQSEVASMLLERWLKSLGY